MSEHAGWLLVSNDGRSFKSPKDKRYLVLRPSERAISIYKKQEDVSKAPSAVLDVTSYLIEREYIPGYDHTIRLTTQKAPTFFCAENAKLLDGWFTAITAVGARVPTDPSDLARRKARVKAEEDAKVEKQKEDDEHELEKQRLTHQKQKRLLKRKHIREESNAKRKAVRDEIEMQWRHEDERRKQEYEHKEEVEDLADKIQEKNNPSDLDELKRKKQVKASIKKQEKEMLALQQLQSKKQMKLSLKQQDDLQKTMSDQHEDEEALADRQESELHDNAQKRKKEYQKLERKCAEELEKHLDAMQWRREKAALAKAAAQVIATQGAPVKAPLKPVEDPEPQQEEKPEEPQEEPEPEPGAEPEAEPEPEPEREETGEEEEQYGGADETGGYE